MSPVCASTEACLVGIDAASNALDRHLANTCATDFVVCGRVQSLLIVVDCLNDTTKSAAFLRDSNHSLALDTEDVKAVTSPVGSDIGEDDAEADQWDDVGNAGAGSIGDSALDWGEDSSTRNTCGEVSISNLVS